MTKQRRDAQVYEYEGQQRTLAEIARMVGLDYNLLYSRIARGMTVQQATAQPKRGYGVGKW